MRMLICCVFCTVLTTGGVANSATIDFSTDDGGAVLVNGQEINAPDEFGNVVTLSSNFLPLAIFDTDPLGANALTAASRSADDLLVGLGNANVLQSATRPTQTTPGIFDEPLDSTTGGSIIFDFLVPQTMLSIDLIDVDAPDGRAVILTDSNLLTRTYNVPNGWTNDLRTSPNGFATLDLTTLADQTGETSILATATEEAGFDASSVVRLSVDLTGSGAVDNLVFVPEPSAFVLLVIGVVGMMRITRQ